jgi:hypothetical protein
MHFNIRAEFCLFCYIYYDLPFTFVTEYKRVRYDIKLIPGKGSIRCKFEYSQ